MKSIPNCPYFIIDSELGKTSFESTYKVKDIRDNNFYTIKKIKNYKNFDKIKKEIKILKTFNSQYIVKYYGCFKVENNIYIVKEYCDDSDLYKFIKEHKENNELIDEEKIFEIINNICLGLKEIHKKNLIYTDLSPKNIFMNKNNIIKIDLFGISKKLVKQKNININNNDIQYMAPEVIKTNSKYNNKVDIWSLGCIIYELFNLEPYYEKILLKKLKGNQSQTIQIDEKYNHDWIKLLNKLLIKKDYNNRLNIDEICDYINKINIDDTITSTSTSSSSSINYTQNNTNNKIFIHFKGEVESFEIFERKISIKEMLKILKNKNIINCYDKCKCCVIYNSKILNDSINYEKTLYKIFGNKNNIYIGIYKTCKILGGILIEK